MALVSIQTALRAVLLDRRPRPVAEFARTREIVKRSSIRPNPEASGFGYSPSGVHEDAMHRVGKGDHVGLPSLDDLLR